MNDNFNDLGFAINGLRHLTGRQAYKCCLQGAIIVDVRDEIETAIKAFGTDNVLFCPIDRFEKLFLTLPDNKPLIIADCVGIHSKEAAQILMRNGYTLVANLAGGIVDWERNGLPMRTPEETMSGQCLCMMKSKKS